MISQFSAATSILSKLEELESEMCERLPRTICDDDESCMSRWAALYINIFVLGIDLAVIPVRRGSCRSSREAQAVALLPPAAARSNHPRAPTVAQGRQPTRVQHPRPRYRTRAQAQHPSRGCNKLAILGPQVHT